jgi:hypothetical protein
LSKTVYFPFFSSHIPLLVSSEPILSPSARPAATVQPGNMRFYVFYVFYV